MMYLYNEQILQYHFNNPFQHETEQQAPAGAPEALQN